MKTLLTTLLLLCTLTQLNAQDTLRKKKITIFDQVYNPVPKKPIYKAGTLGNYLSTHPKEYIKLTPEQKTVVNKYLNLNYPEYLRFRKIIQFDFCALFTKWCESTPIEPTTTTYYPAINETKQYATAADGSALQINIQTPANIETNKTRPVVILTHGTGGSERNGLSISNYTTALVSQGLIVVNFNFYGSDQTRTNNDGKHLTAQYPMIIDFLKSNVNTYHVNIDAILAGGASGSAANAVYVAIQKNLFGVLLQCGGRNIGLNAYPVGGAKLSFASIQQQSDTGFGGYRYSTADAESGACHNGNAWTENTAIAKVAWPGNIQYFTAWGDAGATETQNYLKGLYGNNLTSYNNVTVTGNQDAHCPGGTDWDKFMLAQPKKMFNDRGINW